MASILTPTFGVIPEAGDVIRASRSATRNRVMSIKTSGYKKTYASTPIS